MISFTEFKHIKHSFSSAEEFVSILGRNIPINVVNYLLLNGLVETITAGDAKGVQEISVLLKKLYPQKHGGQLGSLMNDIVICVLSLEVGGSEGVEKLYEIKKGSSWGDWDAPIDGVSFFGDEKPDLAIAELKGAMKIFKANKNISWYRDCRFTIRQIKDFARFSPKFADLWLRKNLKRIQDTFENSVLNFEKILQAK